jgi:hypothetical protein
MCASRPVDVVLVRGTRTGTIVGFVEPLPDAAFLWFERGCRLALQATNLASCDGSLMPGCMEARKEGRKEGTNTKRKLGG